MASHAMMVPLLREHVEGWKKFAAETMGPRRHELDEMNRRHGLTRHAAWLQPTPDGGHVVLVLLEGARPQGFTVAVAASSHPFDRWFTEQVERVHGIDLSKPMPAATLHVDARTEHAGAPSEEVRA